MMKLFERHTRETPDLRPEPHEYLPELPEGVTVPDDLSDMRLPVSVEPPRRPTAVRWLRWVPVSLGLAAGGLVIAVVLSDAGTETVSPVIPTELIEEVDGPFPAGQGPGSNSLNLTDPDARVIDGQRAVTPWPAGEGPGSNSLNLMDP